MHSSTKSPSFFQLQEQERAHVLQTRTLQREVSFYKFQSSKHFDRISFQAPLKASELLTMIQNKSGARRSRGSELHLFHFDSKNKVTNDEIVSSSTRFIVRRVPTTLSYEDSVEEHDGVPIILTTAKSHEDIRASISKKRNRYDNVNSDQYLASDVRREENTDPKRQRNANFNMLGNKELSCGPQLSVGEIATV
jgi:hypothetical protein